MRCPDESTPEGRLFATGRAVLDSGGACPEVGGKGMFNWG